MDQAIHLGLAEPTLMERTVPQSNNQGQIVLDQNDKPMMIKQGCGINEYSDWIRDSLLKHI